MTIELYMLSVNKGNLNVAADPNAGGFIIEPDPEPMQTGEKLTSDIINTEEVPTDDSTPNQQTDYQVECTHHIG